jgi:nucleoside-diphosphate-sugar epimerase
MSPVYDEQDLEDRLSTPRAEFLEELSKLSGDLTVLGAGGKMGPSLCALAVRAFRELGTAQRVHAVSRWSDAEAASRLASTGVHVIAADLNEPTSWGDLEIAENVVFMVGRKFGTDAAPWQTWIANASLPSKSAEHLTGRRVAVFSSGNVYPLVDPLYGGSQEGDALGPVGEYAQSCVARERIFEALAASGDALVSILRLNYAVEMRYGVLVDIAREVNAGRPVDLTTAVMNVCWQGWANEVAIRSLLQASSPAHVINVAGPETVNIRRIATRFGELLGRQPEFVAEPARTALLSNAGRAHAAFGYPSVSLEQLVEWTANWIKKDLPLAGKPTHFAEREGRF